MTPHPNFKDHIRPALLLFKPVPSYASISLSPMRRSTCLPFSPCSRANRASDASQRVLVRMTMDFRVYYTEYWTSSPASRPRFKPANYCADFEKSTPASHPNRLRIADTYSDRRLKRRKLNRRNDERAFGVAAPRIWNNLTCCVVILLEIPTLFGKLV